MDISYQTINKQGEIYSAKMPMAKFTNIYFNKRDELPDPDDKLVAAHVDDFERSHSSPDDTFKDYTDYLIKAGILQDVDIFTPLSVSEAKAYCLKQGSCISYDNNNERYVKDEDVDWLVNHKRPHQAAEAVRRNIDMCTFDEWMAIETLITRDDTSEIIPRLTAHTINGALYEDLDITPMEYVPSMRNYCVTISETVQTQVVICASSAEEAENIAKDKYNIGEISADEGDYENSVTFEATELEKM